MSNRRGQPNIVFGWGGRIRTSGVTGPKPVTFPLDVSPNTCNPHHYANEDEDDPLKNILSVIQQLPSKSIENQNAIMELHIAATKYGNIPVNLPK